MGDDKIIDLQKFKEKNKDRLKALSEGKLVVGKIKDTKNDAILISLKSIVSQPKVFSGEFNSGIINEKIEIEVPLYLYDYFEDQVEVLTVMVVPKKGEGARNGIICSGAKIKIVSTSDYLGVLCRYVTATGNHPKELVEGNLFYLDPYELNFWPDLLRQQYEDGELARQESERGLKEEYEFNKESSDNNKDDE